MANIISPQQAVWQSVGDELDAHMEHVEAAVHRINQILPSICDSDPGRAVERLRPVEIRIAVPTRQVALDVLLLARRVGWRTDFTELSGGLVLFRFRL